MIWNKIYSRKLILDNKICFPISGLFEDVIFNIQICNKAKGIVFLNKYYGNLYKIQKESFSRGFSEKTLRNFYLGMFKTYSFLDKNNQHFPSMEAEMLSVFTKWLLFTDIDINTKVKYLKNLKKFYRRPNLFSRFCTVSLPLNLIINCVVKIFAYSTFAFIISCKLISIFRFNEE